MQNNANDAIIVRGILCGRITSAFSGSSQISPPSLALDDVADDDIYLCDNTVSEKDK
jgi:hypothetical protein